MKEIQIIEAGVTYSASYEVDDRGVCVASAYGSDRAPLGRKAESDLVAKDLLRTIVRAWEPASKRGVVKRRR